MASNTLDERDRAILEHLHGGPADAESLAGTANASAESLQDRLSRLADNSLVERVEGGFALTDDGERVVAASPAGVRDNRIDTPDDVEAAIESLDLRPDRADAVRDAFAFLHYWGEASEREIVDAVYTENPADFDDSEAWWAFVEGRLAELPSVEQPDGEDGTWRYDGTPVIAEQTEDGRLILGPEATEHSSAKFALEELSVEGEEREAVRAAFDHLSREGEAEAAELRETVYPDHDAGYDSADEWWGFVADRLASLPGVERREENSSSGEGGGAIWEYRGTDDE